MSPVHPSLRAVERLEELLTSQGFPDCDPAASVLVSFAGEVHAGLKELDDTRVERMAAKEALVRVSM